MYDNAGYMYTVWPLKKLTLIPKYSIDITGHDNTMDETDSKVEAEASGKHKFSSSYILFAIVL